MGVHIEETRKKSDSCRSLHRFCVLVRFMGSSFALRVSRQTLINNLTVSPIVLGVRIMYSELQNAAFHLISLSVKQKAFSIIIFRILSPLRLTAYGCSYPRSCISRRMRIKSLHALPFWVHTSTNITMHPLTKVEMCLEKDADESKHRCMLRYCLSFMLLAFCSMI